MKISVKNRAFKFKAAGGGRGVFVIRDKDATVHNREGPSISIMARAFIGHSELINFGDYYCGA